MPGQHVVRVRGADTDSPTIRCGRGIAVDWRRDQEAAALVGLDQPASGIHLAGFAAQCNERGVVERTSPLQVVAADHDVGEHASLQS